MIPTSLAELYYAAEWIIRLAMLAVVPLRRTPAAARGWLLLIFFLPVPGLLLFLAIGSPRFPQWRAARFARLRSFFADVSRRLRASEEAAPTDESETARLAERLGLLPAVGGNRVELLDRYDEAIDRLVADIDAARVHVRILVYIFADDRVGRRVVEALARAVARGVACHVLVDPVGSRPWIDGTLRLLREAGVETRAALPFRLLRGRTRRDMRNHRKLFVIDGAIAYTGSQNLVARDFRAGIVNDELVARVSGPAVAALSSVFLADWYLETERLLDREPAIPPPAGNAVLQALPSGADYPLLGFQTLLTWQVGQARAEIVIVTPYLIPDEGLLDALGTAALRGVEVRIIVSAVVDQWLVSLAQRSYYDELLSRGIKLYRYRRHLLHAKAVRIDDAFAVIGSSNFDIRSFQLNEEVSLLLLDRDSIAALATIEQGYLRDSTPLSLEEWRRRGLAVRLAENIARLISPLL